MKIGVFGSAFDPITLGHMVTMEMVCDRRQLDFMLVLPSSDLRRDKKRKITANEHRKEMIRLAIEDNPKFQLCTIEMDALGWETYTYNTMQKLREQYRNDDLYFVIGSDNLAQLPSWHLGRELIMSTKFIVMGREGYDMSSIIAKDSVLTRYEHHFDCLSKGVSVETSSTFIRSRIEDGLSVRYLVPQKALDYALEQNLYSLK